MHFRSTYAKRDNQVHRKRYRATVVILREGKLLLVRDKGRHDFSMPGGGFKHSESTIQAGVREVSEELGGLTVVSAERLRYCDFEGQRAKHKVCRLVVTGEPHIRQGHELDKVLWWDMRSPLPVQGHVKRILSRLESVQRRTKRHTRDTFFAYLVLPVSLFLLLLSWVASFFGGMRGRSRR